MRYIKKFESTGYRSFVEDDANRQYAAGAANPITLYSKLLNGFAIEVEPKDISKFLSLLNSLDTGFEVPKNSPEYNVKTYFILIGERILHSHLPKFGKYEFRVYRPNF